MATQQVYNEYPQNKGTLVPGQAISVNKYIVTVERYLSQGGFAHVYLVRTSAPVFGTTHHVLKRIAVSNEAMLSEVKKEVNIMHLLKGHPNIVHLIDAAWHMLPNHMYEVFILMEYCPGGGIIDMMNRRLRERLTEAEILQIFVDVCEGVAFMHNSHPPLLHRDLKVENILQTSSTSFKLCDFGSATNVTKAPINIQEIRSLEADLNRHTTLQYRAPEMIDLYSKRSVDEKSDVWALGVLLYKLCYYTTPFEEHGQLAILHVQYSIPPYPGYSDQMKSLIRSMLREYGNQRPSVFEILEYVHRIRGTKSQFHYTIPAAQPLSPRVQLKPKEALNTYVSRQTTASKNQSIQALDRVAEAIIPLRRGRPTKDSIASRPASPNDTAVPRTTPESTKNWLEAEFGTDYKKEQKSTTNTTNKDTSENLDAALDAWAVNDIVPRLSVNNAPDEAIGFGDDFAEKLWSSVAPIPPQTTSKTVAPTNSVSMSPALNLLSSPLKPLLSYTGDTRIRQKRPVSVGRDGDAFAGLGLARLSEKQAPTLGEARKLRTGLARFGPHDSNIHDVEMSGRSSLSSMASSPSAIRPQSQYRSPSTSLNSAASSVHFWGLSTQASPLSAGKSETASVESKYPTLEELDATFASPTYSNGNPDGRNNESKRADTTGTVQLGTRPDIISATGTGSRLRPSMHSHHVYSQDGSRSQHVTRFSICESRGGNSRYGKEVEIRDQVESRGIREQIVDSLSPSARWQDGLSDQSKSVQKQRNSVMTTTIYPSANVTSLVKQLTSSCTSDKLAAPTPRLPPRPSVTSNDWLTGDGDQPTETSKRMATLIHTGPEAVVLRQSPSKRASVIECSDFMIHQPTVAHQEQASAEDEPPTVEGVTRMLLEFEQTESINAQMEVPRKAEIVQRPEVGQKQVQSSGTARSVAVQRSGTTNPENVRMPDALTEGGMSENSRSIGASPSIVQVPRKSGAPSKPETRGRLHTMQPRCETVDKILKKKSLIMPRDELHKGSPIATNSALPLDDSEGRYDEESSDADDEPEDPNRLITVAAEAAQKYRARRKGRQSSVHDLVDLWGGALAAKGNNDRMQFTNQPTRDAVATSFPSLSVIANKSSLPRRSFTSKNDVASTSLRQPLREMASTSTKPILSLSQSGSPIRKASSPTRPFLTGGGGENYKLQTGTSPSTSSGVSRGSRPQSLFVFPSVSDDTGLKKQAALAPPEDPRPRSHIRKTSITDMVQRFEAIGGLSPVITRSPSLALPSSSKDLLTNPSVTVSEELVDGSLNVSLKERETGKKIKKVAQSTLEETTVLSQKPLEPEPLVSCTLKPSARGDVNKVVFSRKIVEPADVQVRDPRTSSPERPFRGVGKLIDQWQRKTEEADTRRPPIARNNWTPKRAGLVSGASGRGQ